VRGAGFQERSAGWGLQVRNLFTLTLLALVWYAYTQGTYDGAIRGAREAQSAYDQARQVVAEIGDRF
jgi:hypothetical protein